MLILNKGCIRLLAVIAFACPVISYAQPALTLTQVTQIAINNNQDLIAARYTVSIACARLTQASLWPNPSLNITNTDDRLFNNEGEYSRSIGFTQAFPISGRLAQQKNVACIDVYKALAEIREAERQLSSNVANAFYALIITERRLKQFRYLLGLTQQANEVTHNRYHAAEVSELDYNTARIEYQRINQEKQLLDSGKFSQLALLNRLMGRKATEPLQLNLALPSIILPTLNSLQSIALKFRPDRKTILLNLERADAELRLARTARFADWTLGVAVEQDKIVVEGAPPQRADRALSLSLSVPLPLLNGNQGRIAEASVTGTQALLSLRAINLTIETEVASNYLQMSTLQTALQQTQNTSLKLTLKNTKLAGDAYKNGQLSLLNFMQVQRQQNDLQMTYLANWEKYLQAYVALCTALGTGNPYTICEHMNYKRNIDGKCLAAAI